MARVGHHRLAPRIDPVKALVVDVGWVNGLAAIRSLGRAGIEVLALDYRQSPLGFRSRYAKPVRVPDPAEDEAGFVSAVVEAGPGVVFPTHDPPLNALARNRARLDGFLFPFPDWSVLEAIQDKRHQLETARAAGVDIPETAYPGTASEARAAADEIGLPVLVKPQHPDRFKRLFGRQAFRCESVAELDNAYGHAEPFGPMVQELVPGGDDELYSLGSYLNPDGEALGLFSGRKLKQVPPLIAYRDLTGQAVEPVSMNGARRRWSIAVMPGERPELPRLPFVDAVFARDDLRPGLVHAARVVRGIFR